MSSCSRRQALLWFARGGAGLVAAAQGALLASPSHLPQSGLAHEPAGGHVPVGPFEAIWRAVFEVDSSTQPDPVELERRSKRTQAFRQGWQRVVDGGPAVLQQELNELADVLQWALGRWLVMGTWIPVEELSDLELRSSLQTMATSRLPWRCQAAMGVLIVLGMAHYSQPELYRDGGYSGPPEVLKGLWNGSQHARP
jgi:hypothetical protein